MRITGWIEDRSDYPVEVFGEMSFGEMRAFLIDNGYVGEGDGDYPEYAFRDEYELDETLDAFESGFMKSTTIAIWDAMGNMSTLHLEGKRD